MAVEDTDKISAGIEPVERRVQYTPRKSKADTSKDSVSSPAASVEDRIMEKIKAEPTGKNIQSSDNSLKVGQVEIEDKALSLSKLQEITEGINSELSFFSNSVQFKIEEVDEEESLTKLRANKQGDPADQMIRIKKKEIVVSVVDKRTGEVIRKIPPEDLLQSLYNATMFLGLLIDQIV